MPAPFWRRHLSLQYFTSSQFFAQALRQVMGRPQAWQGLLGRADLLPLKLGDEDMQEEPRKKDRHGSWQSFLL